MTRSGLTLACSTALALTLSGCLGGSEPDRVEATHVRSASAVLTATTDCGGDGACPASYRYRVAGSRRWVSTREHRVEVDGDPADVPSTRLADLRPGTRYEAQVCYRAPDRRCEGPEGDAGDVEPFRTTLRWRPPALEDPQTIDLESHPDYCKFNGVTAADGALSPDRDYIVRLPRRPLTCTLDVRGGRNVVIRGGEIAIPDLNEAPRDPALHRGIYLTGQTGTVHVEGVLLRGDELSVPIVLNEPLGATVQLQQIRAERIFTDYPNWPALHADCVQTWAGPRILRVDGYTCETDYFGLQLSPTEFGDTEETWPDAMEFRHVNIRSWRPDDRTRYMLWRIRTQPRTEWWPIAFHDVWTDPGYEGAGNEVRARCYSATYAGPRPDGWREVSRDENCGEWPAFTPTGLPPDGDFVRAEDVGAGYASPGY